MVTLAALLIAWSLLGLGIAMVLGRCIARADAEHEVEAAVRADADSVVAAAERELAMAAADGSPPA